ncbi:MAG TPA: hypothetical protein PK066_04560 [Saprospiraceae bacterium]|nr:hypothetical protein [Saprospiraceae bacterium]
MKGIMRIGFLLCGLMLLFSDTAQAQQPEVRSRLASDTLRVGIPARLQLEVSGLPDTLVWLPFTIDTARSIAIVESTPWTPRGGGWIKEMRFVPLADGRSLLPGLAVSPQNGSDTMYSNSLIINALLDSSLVEGPEIRPVKDIIREGVKWYDYLVYLWILLGLALLVVVFFVWKKYRKRQAKPIEAKTINRAPEDIAFEKLRKLRDAEIWQTGAIKEYQSELTYILREFLEKKFSIPALEQPSSELLNRLREITSDNEWIGKVRQILEIADLVKFAKGVPGASFHDEALESTAQLIKQSLHFIREEEQKNPES